MDKNDEEQGQLASLMALYGELDIAQCRELYLKQHDNIPYWMRKVLLRVIGAKFVYGENYHVEACRQ